MSDQDASKGSFRRAIRAFFRGIDLSRKILLNLIFFGLIIVLLVLLCAGGPDVPDQAILVVEPKGTIVEQLSGDPLQQALADHSWGSALEGLALGSLAALVIAMGGVAGEFIYFQF